MDSLNYPIEYKFINGSPPFYAEYFTIDPQFGTVKQIKAVDTSLTKRFSITVKVSYKNIIWLYKRLVVTNVHV